MGLWSTTDCQPDEQDRLSNSAAASQGKDDAPKEQEVEAAAGGSDNRKDGERLTYNSATNSINKFLYTFLKTILTTSNNKANGFDAMYNVTPQLITTTSDFIPEGGTRG